MPKKPEKSTRTKKTKRQRAKRLSGIASRLTSYLQSVGSMVKQYPLIVYTIGACILGLAIWVIVSLVNVPEIGTEVGKRAPDFTLQTVDGRTISLSDLRGKIVILDFWQAKPSLCPPPHNPMEDGSHLSWQLQETLRNWPDKKLAILAIAPLPDSETGKQLITKLGITFPLALDPTRKTYADYNIACDPTRIFLDTRGVIRAILPGPAQSQDEIESVLNSIKNNKEINATRPTISNIIVSPITDKKAAINFDTDRPAVSWIIMDKPGPGTCTTPERTPSTTHILILDNLQPSTSYYLRVLSSNANNIESPNVSQQFSFTTLVDTTPPAISNVRVSDITESSARITWSTDEPATGQVEYGPTSNNSTLKSEAGPITAHSIDLTALEADTTYKFTIKSKDPSGNEAALNGDFATSLPPDLSVGMVAPDFTLQTLDGKSVTLSDLRGKKVMVHFWSALCGACKAETPLIQAVFDMWPKENLIVLTISVEVPVETVQDFVNSQGLTFPVLLDQDGKVARVYKPLFPTTYFVDSQGIIKYIQRGAFLNPEEIEQVLRSL